MEWTPTPSTTLMHTVTMETETTSMPRFTVSSRRSFAQAAAFGLAGILLAIAQQPAAHSQAVQPNSSQQSPVGTPEGRPLLLNPSTQGSVISVPEDFASLKLAPGFLLNVLVYDEPDFTGPARIDNEGNINIAFLKPIHVAGETVAQAKEQ